MDVTDIETKLKDAYGLEIFDYLFLFGKKEKLPIDFSLKDQGKLLKEYIITINNFFKEVDQPEVNIDLENLEKSFFETMHELYLFRFLLAQKLYSELELVRVETWFENKILEMPQNDFLNHVPETFSFKLSNTLITDTLGNFNEFSSKEQENKTHKIKSYISSVAFGKQNAETFFYHFRNYTVKEFVPRLLDESILKLCEKIMLQIGIFLSTKVYEFIAQNFSPLEAKNSVLSLINKQIKSKEYYDDLSNFKKFLEKIIKQELKKTEVLNEETIDLLVYEFWNIFCNRFDTLTFFPANYYKIEFRKANPERKFENNFTNLIDLYLIENNGSVWSVPTETYSVELTREAKDQIFKLVTNGFINPNYTLQDYYYLYQ